MECGGTTPLLSDLPKKPNVTHVAARRHSVLFIFRAPRIGIRLLHLLVWVRRGGARDAVTELSTLTPKRRRAAALQKVIVESLRRTRIFRDIFCMVAIESRLATDVGIAQQNRLPFCSPLSSKWPTSHFIQNYPFSG